MKKYLKDIININHQERFNKAELDLINTFANSAEKYASHGLVTTIDSTGAVQDVYIDLLTAAGNAYQLDISNLTGYTQISIDGSYKAVFEGYHRGIKNFIVVVSSFGYYTRLLQTMANPVTNWADARIYISYYNQETNDLVLTYMVKDNMLVEADKTIKELSMNDRQTVVLENPPYSKGGKITAVVKENFPAAKFSILQPLAQYETELSDGTQLFQYVNTIKTVGWTGDSAKVTQNNSIVTLTEKADTNKTDFVNDFMIESFDQNYRAFYDYNIKNYRGYYLGQKTYKGPEEFDIDTTFIEGGRVISSNGGGFTCEGFGYAYNVTKAGYESWANNIGVMNMFTKQAKDNFCCWAYNYHGDKTRALSTKVMWGIKQTTVSSRYYTYIPQIDWNNIHTSQKTLWDAGKYDEAVLTEMGLKWDGIKIERA